MSAAEVNQLELYGHTYIRETYGLLRWLSNKTKVPMVLVGTHVVNAIVDGDEQLVHRFERFSIEPFQLGGEFLGFLTAYVKTIPLAEPTDVNMEFATTVHRAGSGVIAMTVKIMQNAAKRSISAGAECIRLQDLADDASAMPPVSADRRPIARRRRGAW